MDIYCPICSEPVAVDEFRYVADERGLPASQVRAEFYQDGCVALLSRCNASTVGSDRGRIASELYALLGDDIDGAASLLDDIDALGIF